MNILRPYQLEISEKILSSEKRRSLIVLMTGLGKTEIALSLMKSYTSSLFLAHREELILQPSSRCSLPHGILKSGYLRTGHKVQIASIQTLARRKLHYEPDLIIIDEAHRSLANQYAQIMARFPRSKIVGLTATPYRMSGERLPFDELIEGPEPKVAFQNQWLMEPKVYAPHNPDLSKALVRNGEYANTEHLIGDPISSYQKYCQGRSTILFCSSVAQSMARAKPMGGPHVDGDSSPAERSQIKSVLAQGGLVSNCDILTEGFDFAPLECVILARPTKSMNLHFQQIGRVSRFWIGKNQPLIIDHAGNTLAHGFMREHYGFSLDGMPPMRLRKNPPGMSLQRCDRCLALYMRASSCPECGYQKIFVLPPSQRQPMKELTPQEEFKKTITPAEKALEYARLLRIARFENYKDGWADHRFKAKFGHFPAPVTKSSVRSSMKNVA